ncbi:DUF3108 domain-containing protein [Rhodopila sp.]|uniref:DUF3108 domain-containing protein n=1 Tax=Rhodopila sp. TaxID=2480087 RepID=UPI003D0A57A4
MNLRCVWLIGMLAMPGVASGQTRPMSLHLSYETYAAGLNVAEMDAGFGLGPFSYQLNLAYHTNGVVGFFFRGHQFDTVSGSWNGTQPVPNRFFGHGVWRGQDRVAVIDYDKGMPIVRQLVPPNSHEREVVPDALRANTIDTVSALIGLVRNVETTGRCETVVHTYDGRRATEIQAVTVGNEMLEQTSRSTFAGRALRCDFTGRMLAGFLLNDNRERDSKPLHGSAWLAPVLPGGPPVPVRLTFQTRWVGDVTMYLTGVGAGAELDTTSAMR